MVGWEINPLQGVPHEPLNLTIADALRRYLTAMEITQAQLARELEIHVTKLSNILNGRVKINAALAYRLEAHSGLEASVWIQLQQREELARIMADKQLRKTNMQLVRNNLKKRKKK